MTVAQRALLAALAIPLTLVLVACGDDEDGGSARTSAPATAPTTTATPGGGSTGGPVTSTPAAGVVSITVSGGSVEGPSRHQVKLGDQVALRITSDVADEVHVHGYDLTAEVGPNKMAELSFAADIPGTFEVELEKARRRLTTLEVRP